LAHLWFWIKKRQDEWFVLLQRHQSLQSAPPGFRHPLLISAQKDQTPFEDLDTLPLHGESTEPPPVEGWSRFVTLQQEELSILPALPDRPLVVRPFMRISLLPGRWAQFFITVPVWVSLAARKVKKQTVFEEFPSQVLSSTWFGDTTGGELCYALHTPLLREEPEGIIPPHQVVCPLIIRNQSNITLDFQRLCIHVENLEIFHTPRGLFTNQVQVVFKGDDQATQIEIAKRPNKDGVSIELLRPPREPMSRSVLRKTFDSIKEMTGL